MPCNARRTLTLVTVPTAEPVTLDEAKAWARIDTADDDVEVSQLIAAVRGSAEEYLRRALITQSWKLTLDQDPCKGGEPWWDGVQEGSIASLYGGLQREVELPKGPIQSITSVTTYDLSNAATTFDSSNYYLDTAGERLVLNLGCLWPPGLRPRAAAEIVYVAGYGSAASSVPQPIRTGMLIHVASMYEQRGQCADAMSLPPGTKQVYNQYRITGDRLG